MNKMLCLSQLNKDRQHCSVFMQLKANPKNCTDCYFKTALKLSCSELFLYILHCATLHYGILFYFSTLLSINLML